MSGPMGKLPFWTNCTFADLCTILHQFVTSIKLKPFGFFKALYYHTSQEPDKLTCKLHDK